jgi:DNA processing protein
MTILGMPEAAVAPLIRAVAEAPDRAAVAERMARAAWSHVAEPGDGDAGRLVAELGAEAAMAALIARVRDERASGAAAVPEAAVARWRERVDAAAVQLELRQAARFGAALVIPGDPDWPAGLADLGDHAPHALWVRGDRSRLTSLSRSIAIVGARAATSYGEHVAMEAAAGLVDRNVAIVSGAAFGIDGAAHRAALASDGMTIAFLAGGVDRFYPAGHDQLLRVIEQRGAVVSEVPCGVSPSKWRFLHRNVKPCASCRQRHPGASLTGFYVAGHPNPVHLCVKRCIDPRAFPFDLQPGQHHRGDRVRPRSRDAGCGGDVLRLSSHPHLCSGRDAGHVVRGDVANRDRGGSCE